MAFVIGVNAPHMREVVDSIQHSFIQFKPACSLAHAAHTMSSVVIAQGCSGASGSRTTSLRRCAIL